MCVTKRTAAGRRWGHQCDWILIHFFHALITNQNWAIRLRLQSSDARRIKIKTQHIQRELWKERMYYKKILEWEKVEQCTKIITHTHRSNAIRPCSETKITTTVIPNERFPSKLPQKQNTCKFKNGFKVICNETAVWRALEHNIIIIFLFF
jgi:hypothetical protein